MRQTTYVAAVSADKGLVRTNNEDNFYFNGSYLQAADRDNPAAFSSVCKDEIQVYGVFDGMGGEAYGEVASLISAETLKQHHDRMVPGKTDVKKSIAGAVQDANAKICNKILENDSKRIGATFSAVAFDGNNATVINIGDSRVYMLRQNKLEQISVDDTMAQRMVNLGIISPEEAKTHKDKHRLTQHLGIFRDEMIIEPHISEIIAIEDGDRFLICSDGLTDMVSDAEIQRILSQNAACDALSNQLITAALNRGGRDNVTAIVIEAKTENKQAPGNVMGKFFIPALLVAAFLVGFGTHALFGFVWNLGSESGSDEKNPKIYFEQTPTTLKVGEKGEFVVMVTEGKSTEDFEFSVSDKTVLKVDNRTGAYTALKRGTVEVTVEYGTLERSVTIEVSSDKDEKTFDWQNDKSGEKEKSPDDFEFGL